MSSFEKNITIHFRQTDMAGIAYFNEVFNVFHDTYELWVESLMGSTQDWFCNADWAVPLKSVHCDYHAPLEPFKNYKLTIELENIGNTTFRLKSVIKSETHDCATLSTTHIFMNKKTKTAMEIPSEIKTKLELLVE